MIYSARLTRPPGQQKRTPGLTPSANQTQTTSQTDLKKRQKNQPTIRRVDTLAMESRFHLTLRRDPTINNRFCFSHSSLASNMAAQLDACWKPIYRQPVKNSTDPRFPTRFRHRTIQGPLPRPIHHVQPTQHLPNSPHPKAHQRAKKRVTRKCIRESQR